MKFIARLISTGLGVGYFPVAPGTMGTLEAVLIFWFCLNVSTIQLILLSVAVILLGVWAASVTEKEMQEKTGDNELHDPGFIVIDEIAGMLVALIAIPVTWKLVVAAFILFRIFDISKPYPIRLVEKLPSGWGVMMDDVLAGVYANISLQIIILIFHI